MERDVNVSTICISGGFDPIHAGHVRLIQDAARYGNVMVILNSDEWLLRKKGYVFMPWADRADILLNQKGVVVVSYVNDNDGTVCEALERIRPTYFANGGDRTNENTPELALCLELGIKPLFGIGGHKIASSSDIVRHARDGEIIDDYFGYSNE